MIDFLTEEQIKAIEKWNEDRGNTKYKRELETSMLKEEFQEFVVAQDLVDKLDAVADFIFVFVGTLFKTQKDDVDEFEKDSITKFGLVLIDMMLEDLERDLQKPRKQVEKYVSETLNIVIEANQQKGNQKDENGKIIKPKDFMKPEERIQKEVVEKYGLK